MKTTPLIFGSMMVLLTLLIATAELRAQGCLQAPYLYANSTPCDGHVNGLTTEIYVGLNFYDQIQFAWYRNGALFFTDVNWGDGTQQTFYSYYNQAAYSGEHYEVYVSYGSCSTSRSFTVPSSDLSASGSGTLCNGIVTFQITSTPGSSLNVYRLHMGSQEELYVQNGVYIDPQYLQGAQYFVQAYYNGCYTTPVQMQVQNAAPPEPSVIPSNPVSCSGGGVLLTAGPPSYPAEQFKWYSPTGTLLGTGYTFTAYGNVQVGIEDGVCTSQRRYVTVTTSSPSPPAANSPSMLCAPGSVTLTASTGYSSYKWFNSSGSVILGQTARTLTTNVSHSTYFYVAGIDANGCESPWSAAIQVPVRQSSGGTISPASSACSGYFNGLLAQVPTGGATGYFFVRWYRDGTNVHEEQFEVSGGMQSVQSHFNAPAYNGQAFEVRSVFGTCPELSVATYNVSVVGPQASGTGTVCNGIVTFNITATPGVPLRVYRETNGMQYTIPPQNGVYWDDEYSAANHYYVSPNVVGCALTPSQMSVVEITPPQPTVAPANASICPGTNVMLTAGPSSYPASQFKWYDANNTLLGTGYTFPASVSVQVGIETGSCSGVRRVVPITYKTKPPVPQVSNMKVCEPGTVSVSAQGSYASFQWFDVQGNLIPGQQGAVLTMPVSGTTSFQVRGVSDENCVSDPATINVLVEPTQYGCVNYIATTEVLVDDITDPTALPTLNILQAARSIAYFDGLGRPMQTVARQGSPAGLDIVQPAVYDALGREAKKYLPFTAQTDGWYKPNHEIIDAETGDYKGIAANFYGAPGGTIADDNNKPYAETVFEPSPLNRVIKQGSPGAVWQPIAPHNYSSNDYTVKRSYETNASADKVLKWTYTEATTDDSLGTVDASDNLERIYYDPAKLYKSLTKDEQQNEVIEYTDTEGRVILKRVQATESQSASDETYASTYYIYDNSNNLVCVIPPEASKRVAQQSSEYFGKSQEEKTRFLQQWAFRYKYDHRRRMIIKQVPGAKYVYMLYDNRDRLVMTQDGRQRTLLTNKEWTFTKYDALNHPVLTGTYISDASPASLQNDINDFYSAIDEGEAWFENYIGSGAGNVKGYNNSSFPQVSDESKYLTATYYDVYDDFIAPPATQGSEGYGPVNQNLPGEVTGNQNMIAGMITAVQVKNLVTGAWMRTVNYYDDRYRVIQTIADHHKGTVRTSNVYDFTGRLLHSQRKYIVNGVSKTIKESFTYDHAGRQLSVTHAIDGATPPVVMATNEYNELGQLVSKKLHRTQSAPSVTADPAIGQPGVVYGSNIDITTYNSAQHTQIANNRIRLLPGFTVPANNTFKARIGYSQQDAATHNAAIQYDFMQVIDYRYNIRGWLSKINDPVAPATDDLFNMELRYNAPSADGGDPQYNGNISEGVWKTVGLDKQSYGYHYDHMSRIIEAKYFNMARSENNGRYDEKIGVDANRPAYDLNGNILNLFRKGKTAEGTYDVMDDLHYDYANRSNKLVYVSDARPTNAQEEGFKELPAGEGTAPDYAYDANGNMTKDENKGITNIEYNYLNLPSKVSKTASDYIIYTYDATGRKLAQQVFGSEAKTTDYIGELVYENGALQFISHGEGRVVPDNTPGDLWEYQYFMKDHLGNTRVVFSEKSSATEYKATMEDATQSNEMATFRNYSSGVRSPMPLFDHTDAGTTYTYSQLLNGGSNSQVGLAKSFAVNPGDVFDLEVYAKYEAVAGNPPGNNLNSLLSALVSAFSLGAGSTPLDGSQAQSAFSTQFPTGGPWIGSDDDWDATAPKAYLNYLLFNENFELVSAGFDQISTSARQEGVSPDVDHDYLSLHVQAQQKGYLYIYVSNEDHVPTHVYFDDMKIVRYTAVEQVNDYYPFGLTFNSYSRENTTPQDYKYNGKELQDELNLNWLDYGARMYMSDIGRWGVQDPLAELMIAESPYAYVSNNPLLISDPTGMMGENVNHHIASTFVDPTGRVLEHRDDGDNNVYLVNDPANWNGSKNGLSILGQEDPNKSYKVGDQYTYYHSSSQGYDPASLLNYLGNITTTSMAMVAGSKANAMLDDMAVNFVPIWNETGKQVIGFMPKGKGSFAYTAIRYTKGALEFLGPAGDVLFTLYNIKQFSDGKMSGGKLAYNVVSTGAGFYAGFAYGGPVGIAVGTVFFIGEAAYDSIQNLKAMQDRNRTPENTITNWGQLLRKLTAFSKWDFGATRRP